MSEHVYKVVEIIGTSTESPDAAVRSAIERAAQTIRNLRWFEVVQTRGHIENGKLAHYQVTLRIGFTME
ncbi:MAG TPA: dodecin [Beijerinckiaceae bacterium]|nr:dodecin [Beijerinckiaceae bacterium]